MKEEIILASTSPRRKTLLERSGIPFFVVASNYEEDMDLDMQPKDLAKFLALNKALSIIEQYPKHIIVAADTFIIHEDNLLGKPHTKQNAIKTLKKIRGEKINVLSGVAIIKNGKKTTFNVTTKVQIKNITDDEMIWYVNTREPLDCAGAFNVFEKGIFMIEKMAGSYTNVMGLPMEELEKALSLYDIFPRSDTEKWLRENLSL